MATETLPAPIRFAPPPREIVEERYKGLMIKIGPNPHDIPEMPRLQNNSKLYYRLDRALEDLVYGLLQNDLADAAELIVQDLLAVIEEASVRLVTDSRHASWEAQRMTGAES